VRKAIRRLATWMGWKTSYHVAAQYTRDSHMGWYVISMTATVSPWIHADNYREVVDYVKTQCDLPTGNPNITSLTKLGA
jgi:hypothetical protein